jgi:hypothetical protein
MMSSNDVQEICQRFDSMNSWAEDFLQNGLYCCPCGSERFTRLQAFINHHRACRNRKNISCRICASAGLAPNQFLSEDDYESHFSSDNHRKAVSQSKRQRTERIDNSNSSRGSLMFPSLLNITLHLLLFHHQLID